MTRIAVSFSGGKDSALALYRLQQQGNYQIHALLTTLTEGLDRISVHGIRESLLERQAASIGLPLHKVRIPQVCDNQTYEERFLEGLLALKAQGVQAVAYGDIHLQDVRAYRERLMARAGLEPIFPIWGETPASLLAEMLRLGFRTRLSCVDTECLDGSLAGREIDAAFVQDYPPQADCCGENGEYHTFLFDGPMFSEPVGHTLGEQHLASGRFLFQDYLPAR